MPRNTPKLDTASGPPTISIIGQDDKRRSPDFSPLPEKPISHNVIRQRLEPSDEMIIVQHSLPPSRRASMRGIKSRWQDKGAARESRRSLGAGEPQLEPTGWPLSTSTSPILFLERPIALSPSVERTSPLLKSPSELGNVIFLEQIRQFTRRPGNERSSSSRTGKRGHSSFTGSVTRDHGDPTGLGYGIRMDSIIGPEFREGTSALTPTSAGPGTIYMPESPVTAGDKRILIRQEAEQRQAERRKSVRASALRRSRHQAREHAGQGRKKVLLLNETDEERKKREKESVEAWRAWAAACVATNYIQPRRCLQPPLADKETATCSREVSKGSYESPTTTRFPSRSRDASPKSKFRELTRTRSLDGTRTPPPPPPIALDDERTREEEGGRPRIRHAYTEGVEVTIRFRTSTSLSPTTTKEADRAAAAAAGFGGTLPAFFPSHLSPSRAPSVVEEPNALLALRSRQASTIMRRLLLELVHAVAGYVEATDSSVAGRSNNDDDDERVIIASAPTSTPSSSFCLAAVRRARQLGVLDTTRENDRQFWKREVRALWLDLAEAAGNPRYVRTIYRRGEYHPQQQQQQGDVDDALSEGFEMDIAHAVRMLEDLEELLWGELEPPEDELPYAFEVEERIKLVVSGSAVAGGMNDTDKSVWQATSGGGGDDLASWKALTRTPAGSISAPSTTVMATGRRRMQSVWTNDLLSALQDGHLNSGGGGHGPAVHHATTAPIRELDFTQPGDAWTLACPGVKILPGLNTLDLDLNALPVDPLVPQPQPQPAQASRRGGGESVTPSRAPSVVLASSRRGTRTGSVAGEGGAAVGASGKTREQLAEEGRARFAAWKASRQAQPWA